MDATIIPDPLAVTLTFESADLDPSVATITVMRQVDGVDSGTVRASVNQPAVGGWVGDDPEVPPGVTATYYAVQFDSSGNQLANTASISITTPSDGVGVGWVMNPLDETSAIKVTFARTAGQSPARPMLGNQYQLRLKTIALVWRQSLLTGLNMNFYTQTEDDRDAIFDMLTASGGLLLIRTPPGMMIPRMLYCWAQNAAPMEYALPASQQKVLWSNTVNEITAPEGTAVTVRVPYSIYTAAFATYTDAKAAYSSYLDARKNPPS